MVLTLMEELLLLAFHDEKGTVLWSAMGALPTALCGAVLSELECSGRVQIGEKVAIVDATLTGDPILDKMLGIITEKPKEKGPQSWINEVLCTFRKMDSELCQRLVLKGILREEDAKILWIFPTHRYPTNDPTPEQVLRNRLIGIIVNQTTPDNRSLKLLSLISCCDLVGTLFETTEKSQRKKYVKWVKELVKNEPIGKAVNDKLESDAVAAGSG